MVPADLLCGLKCNRATYAEVEVLNQICLIKMLLGDICHISVLSELCGYDDESL